MFFSSWLTRVRSAHPRHTAPRPQLRRRLGVEALEGRDLMAASLAITDVSILEGNKSNPVAVFTITLSEPTEQAVTVNYRTANGTAKSGSDYVALAGTLTFAPGETSKTIAVEVVGDTRDELDEVFVVNLTGAVNAAIWDGEGVGTIQDDDEKRGGPRCRRINGPHCESP